MFRNTFRRTCCFGIALICVFLSACTVFQPVLEPLPTAQTVIQELDSADLDSRDNAPPSSDDGQSNPVSERVTIPEGYTLARIAMLLEEKGICKERAFMDAAQQFDVSSYPLLAGRTANENRCFSLEGYLFPDTYEFYLDEEPETVIGVMLRNFENRAGELLASSGQPDFTADDLVTMASIIQKEAFGAQEMPRIAAVLHNRLNAGVQLQCDVTIHYVEGAVKPFITGDINRYNAYYNTYKCPALPAGAICNPGLDALKAAASPADSDALYFLTDREKNFYFADTWDGHLENLDAAAAVNRALDSGSTAENPVLDSQEGA